MSIRLAPPTESRRFEPRNRLLAALSGKDALSLRPLLEAVPLARGSVLFDVDEPLSRLYFVETGTIHSSSREKASRRCWGWPSRR